MDWQVVAAAVIGYLGQWLKGIAKFPTPAAQAIIAAAAIGLFLMVKVPVHGHVGEWLREAIGWALSVLGVSSVAAGLKAAPRTDSLK